MMISRYRLKALLLVGSLLVPVSLSSAAFAQATSSSGEEELLSLPPMDAPLPADTTAAPVPVIEPLEGTQAPIPAPVAAPIPEPVEPEPVAPLESPTPPIAAPIEEPTSEPDTAPAQDIVDEALDAAEAPLPVAGGTEPDADVDASAPDAVDPAVVPVPASNTLLRNDLTAERPWGSTLMFPSKNLADLITIYDVYLANQAKLAPKTTVDGKAGVDLSTVLKNMQADGKEIPEEVLVLTLNSIVYYNPNDWSVWLNGKRYFRQDALDGFVADSSTLRVTAASKESVTLVWTPVPESINRIAGHWQVRQASADLPKPALMARGERVHFNDDASVTITLTPNQTFLSPQMSVFEGKVSPTEAAASIQRAAQKSSAKAAVATAGDVPATAVEGAVPQVPNVHVPNMHVPPQAPGYQVAPDAGMAENPDL